MCRGAPFDDTKPRYLIRSATTTPEALAERRDLRVPMELAASLCRRTDELMSQVVNERAARYVP